MVSLEKLAALDLLIWLGTLERAAALACTDKSTISRRSRGAQQRFEVSLRQGMKGWRLCGVAQLLAGERQVHQRARFLGRQPLRLEVPYWTQHGALRDLPEGWCSNPKASAMACDDPVTLLRDRIIDACLLTPTQLPPRSDDLLLLDLYRRPIELTLFPPAPSPESIEALLHGGAAKSLTLRLMPFLPRSCCLRSGEWFEALTVSSAGGRPDHEPVGVAFLTPEMRAPLPHPWRVEQSFPPIPYVERLAVLREHGSEAAVQRLQEHLLNVFAPLAQAR